MHRGRRALQDISTSPFMFRGSDTDINTSSPETVSSPSPEEQIIQQRSRSFTPQQLSARYEKCLGTTVLGETPVKDNGPLQINRKRLLLSPPPAPKKPKRARLTRGKVSLRTQLSAYSTRELVGVLDGLIAEHPELEQEVRDVLPPPNIKPMEDKLAYYRHNVFRALPSNRLETSRDAYAFKRVKLHIDSFKKVCVEQGRLLVVAGCWETVIQYVLMAWECVHQLPDWDNPSHNALKLSCFRALATQCMVAIRQGGFPQETLIDLRSRFKAALLLSSELQPCINQLERMMQ